MINIEFTKKKPGFYGSSGVHLYAVKPAKINGEIKILIRENARAIDLYKTYHEVAIFLTNELDPAPNKNKVKNYPVFGNPKHLNDFADGVYENRDFQIVGYLSIQEAKKVGKFFQEKGLPKKENIQRYYKSLDKEVKEELEIALDDNVVSALQGVLESMVNFFKECIQTNSGVVIISNA